MPRRWKPDEHSGCQNEGEEQVFEGLERLKSGNVIADFRHAYGFVREGEEKSEEAQKIDFVITFRSHAGRLHLQVKHFKPRAIQHATEHPDIPCVWIPDNLTKQKIDTKLTEIIKRWEQSEKGIWI